MFAGRIPIALIVAVLLFAPAARAAPLPPDGFQAAGGSLLVSVSAGFSTTFLGAREWRGLLSLTVPLERLAAPTLTLAGGKRRAARKQVEEDESESAPEPASPPPEKSEPAALPALVLKPELARRVVRAALRAAGSARARRRLSSLSSRARSSAALPELRLRGERRFDESLRLAPTIDDPYRYTQAGGTSTALEARLIWRLDRLVFADEELRVERLRMQRADSEARRVERVLATLYDWQAALVARDDPARPTDERALAAVRAVHSAAVLDVYTDGWFSVHVPASY